MEPSSYAKGGKVRNYSVRNKTGTGTKPRALKYSEFAGNGLGAPAYKM